MRVGVIGPQYPDSFADNICDCLPDLGVEVVRLGSMRHRLPGRLDQAMEILLRASVAVDARLQRRIADRAISRRCDMVISVQALLLPGTVSRIKAAGIRTVLWFPDAMSQLDRQLMLMADYYRVYFKDPLLVERIRGLTGLPVAYLPEACNPRWHKPIGHAGPFPEVVVVGTMYPSRVRLLDRMQADNIPLRLYGQPIPRWIPPRPVLLQHTGRMLAREEKAAVFRSASAVLNNLHPTEMASVNCRLFEATGSGAAVLCEDRRALREAFDVGAEVLAFRTYEELRKHCFALLADPSLVRQVGDAAARRAHAEHTYQLRLELLLSDCVA